MTLENHIHNATTLYKHLDESSSVIEFSVASEANGACKVYVPTNCNNPSVKLAELKALAAAQFHEFNTTPLDAA